MTDKPLPEGLERLATNIAVSGESRRLDAARTQLRRSGLVELIQVAERAAEDLERAEQKIAGSNFQPTIIGLRTVLGLLAKHTCLRGEREG